MPTSSAPPPAADVMARTSVRDPDVWLTILSWAVIAFSCAQVLSFSFGRDQGIYAVVAEGLLKGQLPYRDLWDFKPPGIYFIYAAAHGLFGKTMLAPRLVEVAGLLLMVYCFTRLGERFFGSRPAGLLGAALAVLIHAQLDFWHTGQPEAFGGFVSIAALTLTVHDWSRRHKFFGWAGVGLLFGIAFLLKPHLGGAAFVCVAYLARGEYGKTEAWKSALWPVLVVGAASLLPIALCVLWFYARGGFFDLYWTLFKFTPGYTMLGWHDRAAPEMLYRAIEEGFFRFSALAAAGVFAAAIFTPLHSREREGVFLLLGVMSVHFAGIAMQGKFFQYHYSATLPLIAFIGGLGIYKLWRRSLNNGAAGVLAFASFLLVASVMRTAVSDLPTSFWDRSVLRLQFLFGQMSREMLDRELYFVSDYSLDADRRVALEIRYRTAPEDRVFVWGFEPVIYWLSERQPGSRFIYDVPQRAKWERAHARHQLMRDLRRSRPTMIAVQKNDIFPMVTGGPLDSQRSLEEFTELSTLLDDHYALVDTVEDFQLYELRKVSSRP